MGQRLAGSPPAHSESIVVSSLIRPAFLETRRQRMVGDVILVHPISNWAMAWLALSLLAGLAAFLGLADYTRQANVAGVLEPTGGAIKLYAPQAGRLQSALTEVGRHVRKGEVLLVFDTTHDNAKGAALEPLLQRRFEQRVGALKNELDSSMKLQDADRAKGNAALAASEDNLHNLENQARLQSERLNAAEAVLKRYAQLQDAGFISDLQYQQKQDEVIALRLRSQELQASAASVKAELTRQRLELEIQPLRKEVAKVQLNREIVNAEVELDRQQTDHEWSLVAPCDGIVASLTITAHQLAGVGVPLVTIVPANSTLQATMYVPSRAVGFLRAGQSVAIKLDSFPYQKYGVVEGRLEAISATPIARSEAYTGTRLATATDANEPLYTATVRLADQALRTGSERLALQPGMQLEADIQLDTRRLYEWLLEPLYAFGRFREVGR